MTNSQDTMANFQFTRRLQTNSDEMKMTFFSLNCAVANLVIKINVTNITVAFVWLFVIAMGGVTMCENDELLSIEWFGSYTLWIKLYHAHYKPDGYA